MFVSDGLWREHLDGLLNYRRNSRDYEYLPEISEAMIYISMIHIMLRRLDGKRDF